MSIPSYLLTILLSLSCIGSLAAQLHDHQWMLGFTTSMNVPEDTLRGKTVFNFLDSLDLPTHYYEPRSDYTFWRENSSISDKHGNFLFSFNGIHVEDAGFNTMSNGDELGVTLEDFGSSLIQGSIILPYPDNDSLYLLFHLEWEYFDSPISDVAGKSVFYSIINMNQNNGLGNVVTRRNKIIEGILDFGKLTACRHANGRDWWILVPSYDDYTYKRILVTPQGPQLQSDIIVGAEFHREGFGSACFSPDGNFYVKSTFEGEKEGSFLYIYNFGRRTGILTQPIEYTFGKGYFNAGSVSISPNSQFLYLCATDSIFQFDLNASDIIASKTLVAVNDGYTELFPGTNFLLGHDFCVSQLAPDGKIYISSWAPNRVLTTIDYPDQKGVECSVNQHSVHLPTLNRSVPNHPNYRLGPLDGSPADTLGINNVPLARFRIDQDTLEPLKFQFVNLSDYEPVLLDWRFGDGNQSTEDDPSHQYSTPGVYEVCLTVGNINGSDTECKTLYLGSVSTDQAPAKIHINLYPNPCHDKLMIELHDYYPINAQVQIFQSSGNLIHQQKMLPGQNIINCASWPSGSYFYTITDGTLNLGKGQFVKQ